MSDFEDALANPDAVTELRFDFSEDGVLDARVSQLTELRVLQLRRVPPGTVLPEALLGLPHLRHLGMTGKDDRLVVPELVRRLSLEALEVWHLHAGDLPPMPSLRALKIVVENPREEIAILAERFSRLVELAVWGGHLEHGELPDDIERFSCLESLELVSCGVSELPAALAKLRALRSLAIRDCPISSLAPLAGMTQLEEISIERCDRVTDLSPLANLTKLRVLVDKPHDLPAQVVPSLADLEERLGARDASIVEAALDQLARWGAAASTRHANALVVLGIPMQQGEDESDGDDDEDGDDDDDDDDDDDSDDDDDDDDSEGDDEEGAMRAGPWLPALDLALDRHLRSISPIVLARLFGTLFHDTGDDFHAAIRIANELVSRTGVDAAQCLLVDGFAKANEHYDAGNREHGVAAHDTLIDRVFPLLCGAALTRLLTWASDGHLDEQHGDGMLELFVPALERAGATDRAALLKRLEGFLDRTADLGGGVGIVDRVTALLRPVSTGAIGDALATMHARLDAKLAARRRIGDLNARLAAKDTVVAAIAEVTVLPDAELEALQAGLFGANDWDLASAPRRQLFRLWERRDSDRGLVGALAIASRTTTVAELRDDLMALTADRVKRGTLLRAAVLDAIGNDFSAAGIERLRILATEHDGMSRATADSAEVIAVLFGAAANFNFGEVAKGIRMLGAIATLDAPPIHDDENDDNLPCPSTFAATVASMAEMGEFAPLLDLARHLHKLRLAGKPLERILAQLVAVSMVESDPGAFAAIRPLIPTTVTWNILAYNLACKAARDGDRVATLTFTRRALDLGKSPDQFLGDRDFEALHEDAEFVALLDAHR